MPMDFGRLPLQSYCDDTYSPILMIRISFERRGIKLGSVGRKKSSAFAYALKNLRKVYLSLISLEPDIGCEMSSPVIEVYFEKRGNKSAPLVV